MVIITLLLAAISIHFVDSKNEFLSEGNRARCRVIAFEGGGDKGGYQAGVLKGLSNILPTEELAWNVVTGVSAGSLNGGVFSGFPIGEEYEAIEYMLKAWRDIKGKSDIFQNWDDNLGILYGLLFKESLYDTAPLKELLYKYINPPKRVFLIGSTDLDTGTYKTFRINDFSEDKETFIKLILSSSAFPIMFPPQYFNGSMYEDGGIIHNLNLFGGINECLNQGFQEEDIIVDAVLCHDPSFKEREDVRNFKSLQTLERMFEIMWYDRSSNDLLEIFDSFPNVDFRYIIFPSEEIGKKLGSLSFKPDEIEREILLGIRDGEESARMGKKFDISNFRNRRMKDFIRSVKGV